MLIGSSCIVFRAISPDRPCAGIVAADGEEGLVEVACFNDSQSGLPPMTLLTGVKVCETQDEADAALSDGVDAVCKVKKSEAIPAARPKK